MKRMTKLQRFLKTLNNAKLATGPYREEVSLVRSLEEK
jgi:hypothetical protein